MNHKALSYYNYMGYFFIGFIGIMFAPALPYMIREYGLTLALAGGIFPAKFIGGFSGTLVGGIASDYVGRKPVILAGALTQAVALFFVAHTQLWGLGLLFFALAGFGNGLTNTVLNVLTADINPSRRGAALNILHGVYATGCLFGPIAAGALLSFGHGWRIIFYGSAVIWFCYALGMSLFAYPKTPKAASKRKIANFDMKSGLAIGPLFVLLFFVSFSYNGPATGLIGWINTYMEQRDFSLLLGASMVSIFYAGLTAGRFTCSYYADTVGYAKTILICAVGSFAFYPLAVYANSAWWIGLGVFLTGAFMSGLHPTGLAFANSLFPQKAGTVTALLSTSMSIGAMSVPWLIGVVADVMSFRAGLSIGVVILFGLVWIGVRLVTMKKPMQPKM